MPKRPSGTFSKGDVVVVKKGVRDPDFDIPIGGWQGRVEDAGPGEDGAWLYCVAWDSVTLGRMRKGIIAQCARDGLDWSKTYVPESDMKPAEARDTELVVRRRLIGLELCASWRIPQ